MNQIVFRLWIGFFFSWFFSPPILALVSVIRTWRAPSSAPSRKSGWAFAVALAVIVNWLILFVYFLHFDDTQLDRAAVLAYRLSIVLLPFTLLSLVASMRQYATRLPLALANLVLATLWFTLGYAPQHWLTRMEIGSARVEGQQVPAVVYFGNPRRSEAELVALVQVPNIGDYYFDFGEERYRQASHLGFVPLHYGAWSWGPMIRGRWRMPLPSLQMNECRIPLPDGRVLTIGF